MKLINGAAAAIAAVSIILAGSCGSAESRTRETVNVRPMTDPSHDQRAKASVLSEMREKKINAYGEWDAGDEDALSYSVVTDNDAETFTVSDSTGKVLFKETFRKVRRVYCIWALRTSVPQLVVEFDEGGQDAFVQMLDYKDGKVAKIIDETNGANSFGAGVTIQPQFRSGIDPTKEPFEILLTDFGLASPAGKFTRVLRYEKNQYRYVGKFEREKVGDFREKILRP